MQGAPNRTARRWGRMCSVGLMALSLSAGWAQETEIGRELEASLDLAKRRAYATAVGEQPAAVRDIVATVASWITGFLAFAPAPGQAQGTTGGSFHVELLYGCHLGEQARILGNRGPTQEREVELARLTRSVVAGYPASSVADETEAQRLVIFLARSKTLLGERMTACVRRRLAEPDLGKEEELPLHVVLAACGTDTSREWLRGNPSPSAEKLEVLFRLCSRETPGRE